MLVAVYVGPDGKSAELKGHLHFARPPIQGDQIEVEGQLFTVTKAWHIPDNRAVGPKYAIQAWDWGPAMTSELSEEKRVEQP